MSHVLFGGSNPSLLSSVVPRGLLGPVGAPRGRSLDPRGKGPPCGPSHNKNYFSLVIRHNFILGEHPVPQVWGSPNLGANKSPAGIKYKFPPSGWGRRSRPQEVRPGGKPPRPRVPGEARGLIMRVGVMAAY